MDIEQEILALKDRNRRVEGDKAWETSLVRRLAIAIATYVLAGIWLVVIHDTLPWLKAFVPSLGYLFSTVSLSVLKKHWLENRK